MYKLALMASALFHVGSYAATPLHVYTFTEGLDDSVGTLPIQANGGVVAEGRYHFDLNQGLTLNNPVPDSATYTIEMAYRFDTLLPFYNKLIDFSNLQQDQGLYAGGESFNFAHQYYSSLGSGIDQALPGTDSTVVITRELDGNTTFYLNGVVQFAQTNTDSEISENVIHFFIDDTVTSQLEASPGSVDFIRVYDRALTDVEVGALISRDTDVTERDLFETGDGLLTYDPATNREWLDLTETIDRSILDIEAGVDGWADLGFVVATSADVEQLWDGLGIPDIGAETAANTPGIEASFLLMECTWNCNGANFSRSTGVSRSGTSARTATLDLSFVDDPVTGFARFPGFASLDWHVFSAGVYVYREAATLDNDSDGVANDQDNCLDISNPDQRDTNQDGFGNACDPDINNDGVVNFSDISLWAEAFNTQTEGDEDFNGDGLANFSDYALFGSFFLQPPGPSGLTPAEAP